MKKTGILREYLNHLNVGWITKLFLLIFCFSLNTGLRVGAQNLQDSIIKAHVSMFKGNRIAAISYTFDDGLRDQYTMAIPMLEKYNLRGTFFVIPSVVAETEKESSVSGKVSWPKLREASKHGHEIGNHSWSHKNLKKVNDSILVKEINDAWQTIKEKIGIPPSTFAYPWNAFDGHVRSVVLQKHIASRDSTIGIGGDISAGKLNAIIDRTIEKHRWDVIMIHGIAKGFDAFKDPTVLEENFRYARQHDDQLWVSTFSDVVRYIRERNSAELTLVYTPNQIKCVLKTPLDPAIYNQPLTVVFDIKGVKKAKASRSGKKLPVVISPDKIIIDWVPGSEPVYLKWE